ERDDVGEGVELHAELARGPHEPGHATVQQVHDHRHVDRERRLGVPALHRQQQREESAEEVARGEQARPQEDALAPPLAELLPAPPPGALGVTSDHGRSPSTVTPPVTRSPTRTRNRVPRGSTQSVRDPKRIMPMRSPASTLSPVATRQTMRRAAIPAICTTVTRADSPCMWIVQRSLVPPAAGRYAGAEPPRSYAVLTTSPEIGERFTWTSSGERKIATRRAGPTNGSTASAISVTRPSAGDSAACGTAGTARSGSRKNAAEAAD